MNNLHLLIKLGVIGLLNGGVYSLIAIGLSLIFGVMGIINFAHGQMLVLGMYICYWLLVLFGVEPYFSFLLSGGLLFLMGFLVQRFLINRILSYSEEMQILVLVGLGIILENTALFFWGPNNRSSYTLFSLSTFSFSYFEIDVSRLIAFIIALVISLFLFIFLKKTNTGKAIRAAADNRLGAELTGIDVNKIYCISFGIGSASVGVAGAMILPLIPLSPYLGNSFNLTAFVVVILGGLGSIKGAMVGGLILGLVESLATMFIPPSMKQVVSFTLMVIIMLLRPQGLFGAKK